jgi:AAA domain/Domain of unknown function (DUF6371)
MMSSKIDAFAIAESIGNPKRSGRGYMVRCPAHEDSKPSLYVADGNDSSIVLKCHAGCTFQEVRSTLQARGLWPHLGTGNKKVQIKNTKSQDEFEIVSPIPDDAPPIDFQKIVGFEPTQKYAYRDALGQVSFIVARQDKPDGKEIRPIIYTRNKATGTLQWLAKGLPAPRPLYGLDRLSKRPDTPVILVEGEKTANAATKQLSDYVAITWAGGAKGIQYSDFSPLKGRDVTLWPDNDDAGKDAMSSLVPILKQQGAKKISQVQVPDSLPKKWDLADPIPEGIDINALLATASVANTGLRSHVLTSSALSMLDIPPREFIVEPFLPTASLSMIYAERGIGKTWLTLSLAVAISHGDDFLGFPVSKARHVLYIDGEMALYDLKSRVVALDDSQNDQLHLLPSERLFRMDKPLNINAIDDQQRIIEVIETMIAEGNPPELIVFDNLSSLSAGTDENNNSELDKLLTWLVGLRHRNLAVLLVHHAGKSGDQRGASRREDLLDTSIKLSRPKPQKGRKGGDDDDDEPEEEPDGAFFELEFVKTRGIRPKPHKFFMRLVDGENGKLEWLTETGSGATALDKMLKLIALKSPNTQLDLAIEMKRTKGLISQNCKKLREKGFLDDGLHVTREGRTHLITLWPELEKNFMRQENLPFARRQLTDDDVI